MPYQIALFQLMHLCLFPTLKPIVTKPLSLEIRLGQNIALATIHHWTDAAGYPLSLLSQCLNNQKCFANDVLPSGAKPTEHIEGASEYHKLI